MFLSNFHYYILGENTQERIVFIHGLMAFSANWRKIASRMQNDFQCLIYDQRGHGRSFKPEHGYTMEIFAQDLDKITTELGWDQFHLVGHSMGGRTALVFADLYPEKVKTLTLEDIGPDIEPKSENYYRRMLDSVPTPFQTKDQMREFFSQIFVKEFRSKEPIAVLSSFLQANIEEITEGENKGQYDWRFSKNAVYEIVQDAHSKMRWSELERIKVPTLVIRGETSHILSSDVYQKMLHSSPLIEGAEIKETGHWVHYQKYEEFIALLREFIGKHR